MNRLKKHVSKLISPWVATVTIKGFFPETIGKYRILDMLIVWREQD